MMRFKAVKETEITNRLDNNDEGTVFKYRLVEVYSDGQDFNKSELMVKSSQQSIVVGDEYELRPVSKQSRLNDGDKVL
jgi:hypothetical protein